jgi:quercetin dioxygenase-like cupin family protein
MNMPDRLCLPLSFDPALLRRDLDALAATDWIDHFITQNYDGNWSVIPLRCSATARHPVMMIFSDPNATEFVDTPMLAASPYFQEVLSAFRCPVEAVRLMRLTPGSVIKEHNDHDLCFEDGHARFHIAITTNPDVSFELNRMRVTLAPGETWYLRLSDPHRVYNRGTADRVHLVVDTLVNDWVTNLMTQALAGAQTLAASRV